jgi:hypothetical protein
MFRDIGRDIRWAFTPTGSNASAPKAARLFRPRK